VIKRRDFIAGLGAAAWPLAARAQQGERVRRIGLLIDYPADDPISTEFIAGLLQGLQELGWAVGRNVQIDYRWGAVDDDRARKHAAELVALGPDVLVARGGPSVRALQVATNSLPIVFVNHIDPVGAGTVASLAKPGGNVTGFASAEYAINGKLLELLKQISPRVTRVAVLRTLRAGLGGFAAIQVRALSFGVELTPLGVRDAAEIERGVTAFAQGANGGMIVTPSTLASVHRETIVTLAARHQLPTVYPNRGFVSIGGMISFGPVTIDVYRRAAGYVDRILKGEKPADLPVQAPTKYETVLNLKTAKALGLTIPETLLATADEVIQ
jgi:putative ABC transport system substrate-binding protein